MSVKLENKIKTVGFLAKDGRMYETIEQRNKVNTQVEEREAERLAAIEKEKQDKIEAQREAGRIKLGLSRLRHKFGQNQSQRQKKAQGKWATL